MNTELIEPTMVVLDDGKEQHQLMLDLSPEQIASAIEALSQNSTQKQEKTDKPSVPADFILLKTGCDYTRQYDRIKLDDIAYITTEHRQALLCLKNGLSFEMDLEDEDLTAVFLKHLLYAFVKRKLSVWIISKALTIAVLQL